MQSSYAMFMIFYKVRVAKQLSPDVESELVSDSTEQLVEELRRGLERIIAAVSNYSFAFEALDGMRGQYFPCPSRPLRTEGSFLTILQTKFRVHIKRRSLLHLSSGLPTLSSLSLFAFYAKDLLPPHPFSPLLTTSGKAFSVYGASSLNRISLMIHVSISEQP